jgi:hypothetical protein
MRERDRDNAHEAEGARALDRSHSADVERNANAAEDRIRADVSSLAEARDAWADFEREHPLDGDVHHRNFVLAERLAYARVVDELMRAELGEGLRERALSPVDDSLADLLDGLQAASVRPSTQVREQEPAARANDIEPPSRSVERASPRPAAPLPASRPALSDDERRRVAAAAEERIVRPVVSERVPELPERDASAAPREAERTREVAVIDKVRMLEASDPRAFVSVQREAELLRELPQLSTREGVEKALARASEDFERARSTESALEGQFRKRLYALALLASERVSDAEPVRAPAPERTDAPVRTDAPERTHAPVVRDAPRLRPLPDPSDSRDPTPGSAPRPIRFIARDDTDPRERDNDPTRPDTNPFGREFDSERTLNDPQRSAEDARVPSVAETRTLPRPAERSESTAADRRGARIVAREAQDDVSNPGRKNVRAPGRDESREVLTRDIIDVQDDSRVRPVAPLTFEQRMEPSHRARAKAIERELGNLWSDNDKLFFRMQRAAEDDPIFRSEIALAEQKLAELRQTSTTKDPYELARKIEVLSERERNEPDITQGRLRSERLALAMLAREAFNERTVELGRLTAQSLDAVTAMREAERAALVEEATRLLQQPAYNDRAAVNRELFVADDQHRAACLAIARSAPIVSVLNSEGRHRDRAWKDRMDDEARRYLHDAEADERLQQQLANARVLAAFPHDEIARRRAYERAIELAQVIHRLPELRSTEVATPASPVRLQQPTNQRSQ